MCSVYARPLAVLVAFALTGCSAGGDLTAPVRSTSTGPASLSSSHHDDADEPHFDLNVRLRGAKHASGFLKFRQPEDGAQIVYLYVTVRHLTPGAHYRLQRATDATLDGNCTGTNWLTLGLLATPVDIVADRKGRGRAAFSRDLSATAAGTTFDIHFRVIDASSTPVLESGCYQFTVRGV